MASAITGIIWDFGNILARFDHLKACQKLAQYGKISPGGVYDALFSGSNAPTKLHEAGVISSHRFHSVVCSAAGLQRISFREFSLIWQDIFTENANIGSVIGALRPDLVHCILSNTDPIHWAAIEQLPVMRKYFSDPRMLVRSYTSGTRKPNQKMYEEALKRLGPSVNIDEVLYIEDVAEYRDAFERMGGNTLAYDCSKDSLEQLKTSLQKFNLLSQPKEGI